MLGRKRTGLVAGTPAALVLVLIFGGLVPAATLAAAPPLLGWAPTTSPSTYDFGSVDVGDSLQRQFTLTNSGGTASAALAIGLTGSAAFDVVADGCSGVSVGPRKRCSVTIEYTPTSPGASATASLAAVGRKPDASATLSLRGTAGDADAFDGNVSPVVDAAGAVSREIGPDGGAITAAGITLTIPAGALHDLQVITLTPVLAIDGSPLPDIIGALDLQPEGLRFLTPATLAIPRPAGLLDRDIVGFGYASGGTAFHLAPSQLTADTIVLRVTHFSGHGASRASLSEVNRTLGYEPTPAQERADQEIAAAEFLARQDGSDQKPRIKAALLFWYDHSVSTGLAVVGDSLDNLELALGEWVAWKSQVDYYDLEADADLVTRLAAGTSAATIAAAHVADLVLATCTGAGADPFAPIRLVVRLQADLTVVPLPIESRQTASGRQLPTVLALVESCVHVRIEGTSHAPALAFLRDNQYTADAGVVFWGAASPNHTVPLVFTLFDETDGQPLVAPTEVSNGHLAATIAPSSTGLHDLDLTVDLAAAADNELLRGLLDERHEFVEVRSRIDLEAGANPVQSGATTTIRVRTAGDGMAGATVTLSASKGSLGASSVVTNADGEAVVDYTAPNDGSTSASITADFGDAQDVLPLTIGQPTPQISISPTSATVTTGGTRQFTATVTNVSNTAVTWSATGGTVSATGLYTAGATPGTFSVTATTVAAPQQSATATVTVQVGGSITVTDWTQIAFAGASAVGNGYNEPAVQDTDSLQDSFNGPPGSHTSTAQAAASATGSGGATATGTANASISMTVSNANGRLAITGSMAGSASSSQTQGSVFDPVWGVTVTVDARGEATARSVGTVVFSVTGQAITLTCSGAGSIQVRGGGFALLNGPGTIVLQPGSYSVNWSGNAAAISSPPGINDGVPDAGSYGGTLSCSA
jgi:hypothetical protein